MTFKKLAVTLSLVLMSSMTIAAPAYQGTFEQDIGDMNIYIGKLALSGLQPKDTIQITYKTSIGSTPTDTSTLKKVTWKGNTFTATFSGQDQGSVSGTLSNNIINKFHSVDDITMLYLPAGHDKLKIPNTTLQ